MASHNSPDPHTVQELEWMYKRALCLHRDDSKLRGEPSFRQKHIAIRRELNTEIQLYSKASYQEIFRAIQKTLPQELRDMIYSYLYRQELYQLDYSSYSGRLLFVCANNYEHWPINDGKAHCFDIDYFGGKTKLEMAKEWYRTCTFRFGSIESIRLFLRQDVWNLGLDPTDHVRKVQLMIRNPAFKKIPAHEAMPPAQTIEILKQLNRIREGLKIVFLFARGQGQEDLDNLFDSALFADIVATAYQSIKDGHFIQFVCFGGVLSPSWNLVEKMELNEWRQLVLKGLKYEFRHGT